MAADHPSASCFSTGNVFPRAAKTETLAVAAPLAGFGHQKIEDGVIRKSFNEKC
jgi:hypothetical protein